MLMNSYETVNDILVKLFNEIMDVEERALITSEYKDISVNDMHVIEAIGIREPKNMSTVARAVSVTVGTLTIAINHLVKKGYVERRSVPGDARLKCVSLTAKGEESDELNGFDLGVDEYISKPFSPKILVARVEAILRRSNNLSTGEVLKAGGIELDIAAHEVRIDGKEITLSFKEFELLNYFVVNQGVALSREKILNNVWNYDYFGDARTIDTHVKKLRSKLGEKGEYIKTIWGMGYKFEVD